MAESIKNVIEFKGKGYQCIPSHLNVLLPDARRHEKIAVDVLIKKHPKFFQELLTKALENPKEKRLGHKLNAKKQVLDTDGNLWQDTFNKGGVVAYETVTIYGNLFKEVKLEKAAK